jgi:hypothetical protein
MKTLTDDPDWAPKLYEARALAIRFLGKHGRRPHDAATFRVAERNGLKGDLPSAAHAAAPHHR